MKFELEEYHRNTPSEDFLADIKSVANKLNKKSITIAEYEEHGKYHPTTITNRFGSWSKVMEAANLEIGRRVNIPDKELFKNIEEVWIKLGRQPRYVEMKRPLSQFSTGVYDKRLGSWRKALEKFISYINSDSANEEEITNNSLETDSVVENGNVTIKHKTKREISDRLRFRILMRDSFACKRCGRSPIKEMGVELHVDHILPWSKGGETVPENLETKCKKCNLGKGNAFNK